MKIGYIGLGKMGLNMVSRLIEKGHEVVAFNRSKEPVSEANKIGATGVNNLNELVEKLETPRVIWLMVSHQAVDSVLGDLLPLLEEGDLIIDGGNSNFYQTILRSKILEEKKIEFMDVGVSGGPSGALNGACLMIGGQEKNFQKLENLFKDLSKNENSYIHAGKIGSGHFVKMVHNGIEYGMMQSIGEGFNILEQANKIFGEDLNLKEISRVYQNGSVIESRLVGWLHDAFSKYGNNLEKIDYKVNHSGEGEWTVETAQKLGIPAENIKQALDFRKKSEFLPSFTGKVVSAMRGEFGGHDVQSK